MKKILTKLILISAVFTMFLSFCAFDSDQDKVYDYADVLTSSEEDSLQDSAVSYAEEYGLDFVIVTIDDAEGKTSTEYADDFYDEGGFGYDSEDSGVLFLIDFDNRNAYISTCGDAIDQINDTEIELILDELEVDLEKEEYATACSDFLSYTAYCYTNNAYSSLADEYYTSDWLSDVFGDGNPDSAFYYLRNPLISIIVSLVIALIIVGIMAYHSKSKMTANGNTYMDRNTFHIKHKSDVFIGRHTVTRHIPKNNGGGGGSSHMSGGGVGHGGGGRGF